LFVYSGLAGFLPIYPSMYADGGRLQKKVEKQKSQKWSVEEDQENKQRAVS